ncbi:MAG: hypothetical protein E6Q60_03990 [Nitrosomonas oligotropha]|uniref:Uncharacterized protein n=1 Tax=Nitrosomonas oligotropha TaxID=42354 RepID=A0A5C7VV00_9PROT|nr:MAG: hypothetical protein E6Q60_03990 [Nitrosomonas oligotropha]
MQLSTLGLRLLLRTTSLVGRLIALFTSAFMNLLTVIAIIAILAALDKWGIWVDKSNQPDAWLTANWVLCIWALVLIIWSIIQQRYRLLITPFDELGDNKGTKPESDARLSVLLASELAQLRDLFQEFEEGEALQTTADNTLFTGTGLAAKESRLFESPIQFDAQGSFMDRVVSTESVLTIGTLKIPINIFLGLVNRFVQGPRISGRILHENGRCIVIAEFSMGRIYRHWRIEELSNVQSRSLADLAHELAIRIFTELVFKYPARWTALESLTEGIRVYRRTMRTTKDKKLNLLAAEQHFLKAIAEDNSFDLAFYNLGVVYFALGRFPAARNAFISSTKHNPQRFDSQYGLIRTLYLEYLDSIRKENAEVRHQGLHLALDHCDRALSLASNAEARAKVLNHKAVIKMELRGRDYFPASRFSRGAVKAALQALFFAEITIFRCPESKERQRISACALASSSLQQLCKINYQIHRYYKSHRPRSRFEALLLCWSRWEWRSAAHKLHGLLRMT